ncbi:MAG: sigma-70 family RNA polymerase sigma factor [Chloroflexi bacterium]|nr:sigma-70 family RNA polymerase sigma factor [Chloroflexota bacterium]
MKMLASTPTWQENGRLKANQSELSTQSHLSEQDQLLRLANGEQTYFWQLWLQYRPYLYRILLNMVNNNNHQEVEDLLSQIMLKAWQKAPHHAAKIKNFKAWLTIVAKNYYFDLCRKEKRAHFELNSLDHLSDNAIRVQTPNKELPENILLQHELSRLITDLIEEFPTQLKETVQYRLLNGMPYRDIAQKVGITSENARKINQKGRHILRREIIHYFAE